MTRSPSRRDFVKLVSVAATGLAFGAGSWSCGPGPAEDDDALTPAELDEITLLGRALFEPEGDSERSALDATMRWWAMGRASIGNQLDRYRAGLAALAEAARLQSDTSSFGTLTELQRSAIVARLMRQSRETPFRLLADELIQGIYSSAPGWNSLGYTTWPGTPSAPLEYTTRPHTAPGQVT